MLIAAVGLFFKTRDAKGSAPRSDRDNVELCGAEAPIGNSGSACAAEVVAEKFY